MKYNINLYISICLMLFVLVGCEKDYGEESQITEFAAYTIEGLTPQTVTEAGTYTFDFSLGEAQVTDVHISISATEASTATEGVDFELSTHDIELLALSGGGSFDITVNPDYIAEGSEDVVISIGGTDIHGYPTTQEITILTIRDSVYSHPSILLDWEGTFEFNGSTFTKCGNADIDMYFVNEAGETVEIFDAATAACPEILGTQNLPDGNYTLVANLNSNGLNGIEELSSVEFPLTVKAFIGGKPNVDINDSNISFNTANVSGMEIWNGATVSDPDAENLLTIGSVTKSGTSITLFDANGNEIGSL